MDELEQISNTTCTKCQVCGGWTNYAGDEHHKFRVAELGRLRAQLAERDRIIIEHCPDQMTDAQWEEWGRHQRPVTERGEPVLWIATVNGTHEVQFDREPPDDAYDAGTLRVLYEGAPPAQSAVPDTVDFLKSYLNEISKSEDSDRDEQLEHHLETTLRALSAASAGEVPSAVPKGFRMVPVEPTAFMLTEARATAFGYEKNCAPSEFSRMDYLRVAYIAAINAAPSAGEAQQIDNRDWSHIANEWADVATSGIQWVRNIRDGVSNCDEALADMQENVERVRAMAVETKPIKGESQNSVDPWPTLIRIAEYLEIDIESARSAPGKPSDVFIQAIEKRKPQGDGREAWRQIDDLPEEGQWALVYWEGAYNCAFVKKGEPVQDWTNPANPNVPLHLVTHWMPLPEPPAAIAAQRGGG